MSEENVILWQTEEQIRAEGEFMTFERMKEFISRQSWTFAKTMADFAPHEYILKFKLSEGEQKEFERVVIFIRDNGYEEFFGKRCQCYFVVEGRKYWTMGDKLENTYVLNRCNTRDYKSVYRGRQEIENEDSKVSYQYGKNYNRPWDN